MKKSTMLRSAVALLVVAGAGLFAAPAQAAENATVSVLHAVPDTPVDVYVNGDELLTDFEPGTLTDPQKLPAGEYDLKVVAPGDGADGKALIEAKDVKVPGGANITVVAHLDADGKPTLTPYVNDVSALKAGQARLTVRHVAAAPEVDVRAGEKPVFEGLANPDEAKADLDAGTVSADVTLAGTDKVAIGPAELTLKEGTNTIVYAWGSAEDKNLKLATQAISGLHGDPGGVPGGTGGQAAVADATLPLIGVALVLAAVGGVVASRRMITAGERR